MSDATTDTTDLLVWDADETARRLMVTADTIRNLHRLGKLRGVLIGRSLRWIPEHVRDFVESLGQGVPT